MPSLRLFPLALLGALALPGCDTGGPETPDGPRPVTVRFDWSDQIEVLGDCEAPDSNVGEFWFWVELRAVINGTESTLTLLRESADADAGDRVPVSEDDTAFTVSSDGTATFSVRFEAQESDPFDVDLGLHDTRGHLFSGGQLSPSGQQSILLTDRADCRVRLNYSVSAS